MMFNDAEQLKIKSFHDANFGVSGGTVGAALMAWVLHSIVLWGMGWIIHALTSVVVLLTAVVEAGVWMSNYISYVIGM